MASQGWFFLVGSRFAARMMGSLGFQVDDLRGTEIAFLVLADTEKRQRLNVCNLLI